MQTEQPSLYEVMKHVDALIDKAVRHPQATDLDKVRLLRGRLTLHEVRHDHMPKMLPLDPATLPAGRVQTFAPVPGLAKGRLLDWEQGSEVAS